MSGKSFWVNISPLHSIAEWNFTFYISFVPNSIKNYKINQYQIFQQILLMCTVLWTASFPECLIGYRAGYLFKSTSKKT